MDENARDENKHGGPKKKINQAERHNHSATANCVVKHRILLDGEIRDTIGNGVCPFAAIEC